MATEQYVVSTLSMRLQQCDVLLEWLIAKHPGKDSLHQALESLRQVELIVTSAVAESH